MEGNPNRGLLAEICEDVPGRTQAEIKAERPQTAMAFIKRRDLCSVVLLLSIPRALPSKLGGGFSKIIWCDGL